MLRVLKAGRLLAMVVATTSLLSIHSPSSAEAACMPASLRSTLAQIKAKFGPVSIVSTHRPGARIAGSGRPSYHASCRAVDFHPPKGKYGQVVAWLKSNHSGGLGTYSCGMHHIHIDNGPNVRFHKCQGSGGRVYASKSHKSKKYAYKGSSSKKYAANSSKSKKSYKTAAKAPTKAPVKVAKAPAVAPAPVMAQTKSTWKMTSYAH